ncbi:PTS galactosamine/N-acetylgalactosamine transporter subunit IIA [Floccifex sp.]|uniref:PTS galactosamine/N-acetylgalactosamine transporter subunit IIA n=1 Tax=Floccifex sp. TaxID=2815810 RepID=UPI003F0D5D0D
MIGFIITGHGRFATGISVALELIMGKQEHYVAVDFLEGDTKTEIEKNIHLAIESLQTCDSICIFCDLLRGSPFNTAILEAMNHENIEVLYGTNLGMLMESVMKRNMGYSLNQIVQEAIETGKKGIGKFEIVEQEDDEW